MRSLSANYITNKNLEEQSDSWIWLFEIRVSSTLRYYLTSYTANISFDGNFYRAYPLKLHPMKETRTGELQETQLTLSTIGTRVPRIIHDNTGLVNKKVIIRLVHSQLLAADPAIEYESTIISAGMNDKAATFRLGHFNLYSIQIPRKRYTPDDFPAIAE
jgi:phage-related protein|tara:strand:+ start:2038 stop:2517 length:480 start_codon:yes stop_codon:yes gene_type:complete